MSASRTHREALPAAGSVVLAAPVVAYDLTPITLAGIALSSIPSTVGHDGALIQAAVASSSPALAGGSVPRAFT